MKLNPINSTKLNLRLFKKKKRYYGRKQENEVVTAACRQSKSHLRVENNLLGQVLVNVRPYLTGLRPVGEQQIPESLQNVW